MNRIEIKGRLAKDPIYGTATGKKGEMPKVSFDLISDKTFTSRDENGNMPTNYFNCQCFHEHSIKYLRGDFTKGIPFLKGDELLIYGSINSNTANENTDKERVFWNVIVTEVIMASRSMKNQAEQAAQQAAQSQSQGTNQSQNHTNGNNYQAQQNSNRNNNGNNSNNGNNNSRNNTNGNYNNGNNNSNYNNNGNNYNGNNYNNGNGYGNNNNNANANANNYYQPNNLIEEEDEELPFS